MKSFWEHVLYPFFLFLLLGPYLVEKRKLSVVMFVLACILPLPVAFCYVICEILARTKTYYRKPLIKTIIEIVVLMIGNRSRS